MSNPFRSNKEPAKRVYSDKEINELAQWLEDLTLKQIAFLKESYDAYLMAQAQAEGATHVH